MNHPSSLLHPAFSLCCLALPCLFCCLRAAQAQNQVEQWGIFELALQGPTSGNPFTDVRFTTRFYQNDRSVEATGFYDGDGVYRVRFMTDRQGAWHCITSSSAPALDGKTGEFTVTAPSANNHGPVRVAHTYHFAYADGTAYTELGTTCYAWIHQSEELQEETLKTLASAPFNKIRFCVFPKRYAWNTNEPVLYPYEGIPPRTCDFQRFNPKFFRHLEQRVLDLQKLGIQADIILFHLTHASIQNGSAVEDPGRAELYRDVFRKPVVYDEVKYEGNIPSRWGNLSAEELVFRFWNGTVAGTYVGHGETYLSPDDVLWRSKGGVLKGQSPARLAFLKKVLEDSPPEGINPIDKWQNPEYGGQPAAYYLVYLGKQKPATWTSRLPKARLADGMKFRAEVLDTWNMTVTPVPGTFTIKKQDNYFYADEAGQSIPLPGRPYLAIRIKRVHGQPCSCNDRTLGRNG